MELQKIKRFPYTDILGWSISRYDKFLNCKRQYFYDYYGKYDKEFSYDKIQQLKALTSTALEIGNIVHDTIRDLLVRLQKTSKPIDKKRFLQYTLNKTKLYCNSKTFGEVYYKQTEKIDENTLFPSIREILNNFLYSTRLKWIFETAIKTSPCWIIEPDGFGETRINNYKAYCKVDFLIPAEDKIFILDWKTGKKDIAKHSRQLIGYALWACYHFNVSHENVFPTISYLQPAFEEYNVTLTENDLHLLSEQVVEETNQMYQYLTDINKNIPKDKECFEKTQKSYLCKYCNYREICLNK